MTEHVSGFVPDPDATKLADLYARAGNFTNPAICVTGDEDDIQLQEHVPGESILLSELAVSDIPSRPRYVLKGWKRDGRWDFHVIGAPLTVDKYRVEEAYVVSLKQDGSIYSHPYTIDADGNVWE